MRVRWVFSNSCSEAYCKVICKELFLLLRASITSVCPPPSPQLRHCPSNIFYVGLNKTVQQIWQSLVQSCCTYIYLLKNYLPNKNLVWDFEEKIKNMIFWAIIDHNRRHLSKFREKNEPGYCHRTVSSSQARLGWEIILMGLNRNRHETRNFYY